MVKLTLDQPRVKKPRNRKKVTLIVICTLLIVLLVVGLVAWLNYSSIKKQIDILVFNSMDARAKGTATSEVYDAAKEKVFLGSYDDGQKLLDNALEIRSSKQDRARIYELKCMLAFNNYKFNDALKYALKAEEINPTYNTANLVALSYQNLGYNQLAIENYQKFLDRFTPQSDIDQTTIRDIKATIEELKQ